MMDIKIFQEKLEQILAQAREQDKPCPDRISGRFSGRNCRPLRCRAFWNICGCRGSGWM